MGRKAEAMALQLFMAGEAVPWMMDQPESTSIAENADVPETTSSNVEARNTKEALD